MSPAEDAALLLRIVRRHLQAMRLNLDPLYPDEEWGFQAQQALEKLLKSQLVLRDQVVPCTHELLATRTGRLCCRLAVRRYWLSLRAGWQLWRAWSKA
jgi:HEPN domain-containing protein